jgi:hypothetical protein
VLIEHQLRATLNNNTNADPMMIAGQKAFATSFIVSSQSSTNVGLLSSHRR